MNELVAVLAAVVASIAFGASDVVEQRATHTVAKRGLLDPRLFLDLFASRVWRVGITLDISASVLQAVALHFGQLSLVQPILVCDLLFAALISAAVARRRPDRVMAAGILCCTGGLALFQAVARPAGDKVTVSPSVMLPLGAGLAVAVAICPVVARFSPKNGLPLATAFACGAVFGVTAFLLKEITQTIGHGFSDPSQQWALYAFIILEPIGFLLNQNAFQESTLIAPVLAIRTVTDPLVAIGIGLVFLNERIASGPADIAAEVVGLAIMSVGVYALAHRSPQLAAQTPGATAASLGRPRGWSRSTANSLWRS
jgi:hypothetical protein